MKISISPFLVLRIPAFSFEAQITTVWEDLKTAIHQSSPDFYDKIKTTGVSDLSEVDPKTQYTIWKYFNRAKYRGTPYGSFAGFATAELSNTNEGLMVENEQHLHTFKDWGIPDNIVYNDPVLFDQDRLFFANTSIYITTRSIRFLCIQEGSFELAEIERSSFIEELLDKSKNKITYAQLCLFAAAQGVEEQVLRGMLQSLVELQLLFTDLDRNIIGADYFIRTGQKINKTDQAYLIAERKVNTGTVNKEYLKSLPACINYLLSIRSASEHNDLNNFKTAFIQRFEYQEIPLMKVLDPEFGLGYGGLENSVQENTLINELLEAKVLKPATRQLNQHELSSYLLNILIENKEDRRQVIQLEGYKPAVINTAMPANSFTALLKFADDLIVLDHAGGVTANALAGRFTLVSEDIESHCKDVCAIENEANPDVIFFDMAYMAEGRVDNINRRKAIYDYELPLLNYSCNQNPIQFDDLLVTVKNNEVVLLSRKYGKRVVPKLASAYNYNRSDLSVYRFLCDLQHQNIQTQILFDIQSLIPGLNFYPRVQYHNVVLSPAKWSIQAINFKNSLKQQLDLMQVCRYFTAGNEDQTLLFDQESELDMHMFKRYLDQHDDFMITEAIIANKQVVNDCNKKSYHTQFMVTLHHSEQLYKPYSPGKTKQSDGLAGVIAPGKDWLYFEVYCHHQRSDLILNHAIAKFIERYKANFKCWFFIRYDDPSSHIRIRLQLKEPKKGYFYTSKVMEMLDEGIIAGLISDVQIKTYKRELQRYGHNQIEMIEHHFGADSDYALTVIEDGLDAFDIYANCIGLMKAIITELNLDDQTQLNFIKRIQDSFITEHHLENKDFKKINKEYAKFAQDHNLRMINESIPEYLLQSFKAVIGASSNEQRQNLFGDLFHMHINRLFNSNQRTHELIIYSFFYKQLQRDLKNVVYA